MKIASFLFPNIIANLRGEIKRKLKSSQFLRKNLRKSCELREKTGIVLKNTFEGENDVE